jgi:hypothetical protein
LEIERNKVHSMDRLKTLEGSIFVESTQKIINDRSLYDKFHKILANMPTAKEDVILLLYQDIIQAYMAIGNNEFRKELCATLGKIRKLRHGAEIYKSKVPKSKLGDAAQSAAGCKEKGRGKGTSTTTKMGETDEECTAGCKGKGRGKGTSTTTKMGENEEECIARCKGKGRGKENSTRPKKGKTEEECVDWICCDKCNQWFKRCNVGLRNEKQWKLANDNNQWHCDNCKKLL